MRSPALALSLAITFGVALSPAAARADVAVVTDIAPIHSLVSMVMEGVGTPAMLIPANASPHGASLRPSDAAALSAADLVFWVGHELTPWLEGPIETLAGNATAIALLDAAGTIQRDMRSAHVHDHGDHDDHAHDEHAHDEHKHDDHAHDDHKHDDHAHDEHAHDDHDDHADTGFGRDAHAWLDPVNAQIWLNEIAAALSRADPANATTYFQNAEAARGELATLIMSIETQLLPKADRPFVVFHDAYIHFEARFGLTSVGAISLSDAQDPSPASLSAVRDEIRSLQAVCVFSEPQHADGLVRAVTDGTAASIGILDPIGADLTPGPDFYPALIAQMAASFEDCL
jgi:zinc transport system substrate-binding protein